MQLGVLFGSQLLGGFGMKLAVLGASVAGSMLLNGKQKPQGKLNDLRVSGSSYGRGIAEVFGTIRVTGNMIWSTNFEEEKSYMTQKGKRKNGSLGKKKAKKGKATETYEYYANFAMGLCAGPVDSILRIWADNNLIYDKLNPKNKDIKEIGFTRNDSQGGGKRESKSPARKKGHDGDSGRFSFRFYSGSETQPVDPFIKKKQGENAVPFRGLSYLFFEHFSLADFGNRVPTITAEVSANSQRQPIVRSFQNMEPKDMWAVPFQGPTVMDPVRQRLYHKGLGNDGVTYIRAFDLADFKEIKRIPIAPKSAAKGLPQRYRFYSAETDNIQEKFIDDFGQWIGVSQDGDFMFQVPEGNNYRPIYWVDPESMLVKYKWGTAGNFGQDTKAILAPQYATPYVMNGNDLQATPRAVTLVTGLDNNLNFFNKTQYELFVKGVGFGSMAQINPGAYGTDNAIVYLTSNIYSLKGNMYGAPVDEADLGFKPGRAESHELYEFPPPDENDGVWISALYFASYCTGARAIAAIGFIQTGTERWPGGLYAITLDPKTLKTIWCEKILNLGQFDFPSQLGPPVYLNGNKMSWFYEPGGDAHYYVTVDFRNQTCDKIAVGGGLVPSPNKSGQYYYSDLESILYMTDQVNPGEANWVMVSVDRKIQVPTSVADICYKVATRVGIPGDRLDFSGLTNDEEVTGYMIENPTPARQILEELANVFMFDVAESDNKLKFKTRGGDSLVTIPQRDLGVVDTDFGGENEYYSETRQQEVELPERVNVSFLDPKEDYEQGTQHYKRPLKPLSVMHSQEILEVTMNMAMTPDRAKTLAQRILFAAWGERTSHKYTLPRDYLMYEPGDVITIELENGERFTDRLTDVDIGANLSMEVNTVSMIASAYTMETGVDDSGGLIIIPRPNIPTVKPGIFDVPYLSDDDVDDTAQVLYYWNALAYSDGFRYGVLFSQLPGDEEGEEEGATAFDAIWGTAAALVDAPPYGCELTDDQTKIVLSPAFDFNATEITYSWESIPAEQWPSKKNMIIIGDEVILFRDVEVDDDTGLVTISHLIRGAKGTAEAAYKHVGGEDWIIVTDTMQEAKEYVTHLGKDTWFTLQSQSPVPPAVTRETKAITGATRKPWQVGAFKRAINGQGLDISWQRATRYGGELKDTTGSIPLNEETEKYEFFLLKAPCDPFTWDPEDASLYHLHVENILTPTVNLSFAQLTAAGLTNTSNVHVVVYQMSATVGRGFTSWATIPYSQFAI